MAKFLLKMDIVYLARMIVCTLLNKFDFFLVIEGNTGTGKSTLAIHLARKVKSEFRKLFRGDLPTIEYYYNLVIQQRNISMEEFVEMLIKMKEKRSYDFKMKNDLIYTQKAMKKHLSGWHKIFIPDEMINITFNRDFGSEEQKNIIKMINMYRDHQNFIIASVPAFQTLDVQIKNLCKMRISIAKRGAGVVQTPNKIFYGKDRWDSANNEKIEREWLVRGGKPKYAKLTTARGLVRFRALSRKLEEEYQAVKDAKRTDILKKDMNMQVEDEKKDCVDKAIELLEAGEVRDMRELTGMGLLDGIKGRKFVDKVRRRLEKQRKPTALTGYFWDANSNRKNKDPMNMFKD
jgi:hypothetical protein